MKNSIKPDKKLFTKLWCVLLTLQFLLLLIALILQIFIPLEGEVSSSEISSIVWPIYGGIIFLSWIITAPIVVLWIKNLEYMIEDDRIIIHKGILTKVRKNIPYRAITDFILHRSLYDRFLGIASIRIQTAGQTQTATGYEGNMAGLINWEELHQNLREKIKHLHPISESLTTQEKPPARPDQNTLELILKELKAIRKALEK